MMRRYQVIEKIVDTLEKLDDRLSESREEHRDQWDYFSEKIRQIAETREAMRKHLTLTNGDGEKIAYYFEDSLMFGSKIMQEPKDVDLLRMWLEFMNERVEEVNV